MNISYTDVMRWDNERLEKKNAPYRFDVAGFRRCAICGEDWDSVTANWKPCEHNTDAKATDS